MRSADVQRMEEQMFTYGKMLLRVVILLTLVAAVIILSQPAPVSAFSNCCVSCNNIFNNCVSGCDGDQLCIAKCERVLTICQNKCPGGC